MSQYSIYHMRDDISAAYDSPTWKHRVKFMPDHQVFAIWHKFYAEGKFDKKLPKRADKMAAANLGELLEIAKVREQLRFETDEAEQLSLDL